MPLPNPGPKESHDKFIDRCMGDDLINDEYPDSKQRMAVCSSIWDRRKLAKGSSWTLRQDFDGVKVDCGEFSWDAAEHQVYYDVPVFESDLRRLLQNAWERGVSVGVREETPEIIVYGSRFVSREAPGFIESLIGAIKELGYEVVPV